MGFFGDIATTTWRYANSFLIGASPTPDLTADSGITIQMDFLNPQQDISLDFLAKDRIVKI